MAGGMTTSPEREAALALARQGYHVFPCWYPVKGGCGCGDLECEDVGKHPLGRLVPHGLLDATTDEDIIARWWSEEPRANPAINCGRSHIAVLDNDPRNGGDESLARLESDIGGPIDTAHVKTGGGGDHFIYEMNGTAITSGKLAGYPGIDVKAKGGYIVAVGALHASGRRYSWADACEPQPIPDALLTKLPQEQEREVGEAAPEPRRSPGGTPGDDFNARGHFDGPGMLPDHGYRVERVQGSETFWTRPGKKKGVSVSTNYQDSGYFYAWTTSTEFEPYRGYSKFAVYTILNHNGDFSTAAADLARQGYGTRTASASVVSGTAAVPDGNTTAEGLPADALTDAVDVAREGQRIEAEGIPYLVGGLVPALGMLGFLVAYTKVGKTTFAQALGAAVAMGREFLGRTIHQARVLVVAAEDPPEYVAWLARHLEVEPGRMTFYRRAILLNADGLDRISHTVKTGGYGLVLIASWQAVVRTLTKDENDNAGAVNIVENTKAVARLTGIPWLIDAHSGKSEDQADDADPTKAMRGASAAPGAADYLLSLRYANGTFGTQRRLSGRGRFVNLAPIVLDFDNSTSTYSVVAESGKDAASETTWRLICDMGALTSEPRSAGAIAKTIGMVGTDGQPTSTHKRHVAKALTGRADVLKAEVIRPGGKTWGYRLASEVAGA